MNPIFFVDHGVPFALRVVKEGERYGRNGCLQHEGPDDLIEVYDMRFPLETWMGFEGQFITRYYRTTFEEAGPGLLMDISIPMWRLSPDTLEMLQGLIGGKPGSSCKNLVMGA